ncbi:MAG: Gfo/Idh/MocA family oxidoreductase [Gemmataceae bacterium]|nr:Gfo/Idh/MocA family oxidoreductase [Gemmataceae bacterium]MDW8265673.1 Gfo/Idh/MocA family oxidoreductase [Gemmataceae bacterium]
MTRRSSRRQFLQQSVLSGVGFWVAGGLSRADSKSPNERLNFACIGVGGKGSSDTDHVAALGNIVALCDVDSDFLGAKAQKYPKAKTYVDFRKMFDEMGKEIDAVTVSTPDHTHAVASVMALRLGKHVYCQKPLTHSVYEARVMRELAAKMGVCTQMGNQGTAHNSLRTAVEIIRSGAIGPVREVHVWTNRPIWPQAPTIMARPKIEDPVPEYLNWDLWLGPAPYRPYSHGNASADGKKRKRGTYHDFNWRGWWDFGTGALGDMGCHTANMPFMALELQYPVTVEAECGDLNPETCPSWATVVWEFPKRGDGPHQQAVKFFWYEGKKNGVKNLPPKELFQGENPPGSGALVVGDKGTLYSPSDYGGTFKLLPAKEFEGYKPPPPTLPRNGKEDAGHKAEWVEAIRNKKPEIALSNFAYAGLLTETILLGNVAMRVGKKLQWDGPNCRASNCPEADIYIRRPYRQGWTL